MLGIGVSGFCMVGASSSSDPGTDSVRVTVEVTVGRATTAKAQPEAADEWEVISEQVAPAPPVLLAAVRDRLAGKLSSKQARSTPKDRITKCWQAGVDSRGLDLGI